MNSSGIKHLHVVSFDVPWPASYGGVIDVFWRLKTLQAQGVHIHLHCFEYGRGQQPELEKYCHEVHYYPRHTGLSGLSFNLPYVVNSRRSDQLLARLRKDGHPVLLEGIHCTYLLHSGQLPGRKIFVRLHNVEHNYYRQLALQEKNIFKKIYYLTESKRLKKYERLLAPKGIFFTVAPADAVVYNSMLAQRAVYLPASLPVVSVSSKPGRGNYCLYHGNLSIADNGQAAERLCSLFGGSSLPLVIAGHRPGSRVRKIIEQYKNIRLVANPGEAELLQLVQEAQVNLLPSMISTGIKIKLLYAAFNGRHCLTTEAAAGGMHVPACHFADSDEEWKQKTEYLFKLPFTENEIAERKTLEKEFDNMANAAKLMQWIY